MPPRNLTIIFATSLLSIVCYLKAERNRYAGTIADAMETVSQYYVEEVDTRVLFEDAMKGMVGGLDQYSGYIGPDTLNQMNASLDQQFGGVGVKVEKKQEGEPLTVLSPLVGTPAYRAGIQAGDKILAVDGQTLAGIHLSESVKLMRGVPGSELTLTILRAGREDTFEVTIVREIIKVDSVFGDTRRADGSWDFHLEENRRIGYLRLTTFGQRSVEELKQVLSPADNRVPFEAIIIDLRGNAGGLLDTAVKACDLFIDSGRIVSTNGRNGVLRTSADATDSLLIPKDIPIVVLVNEFSASASEILAACLQDHKRAVIVGERTWGKGTVQNILDLEGGRSALKLTTATYWRPNGKNIHRREGAGEDESWGVAPDEGFAVPMEDDLLEKVFMQRRQRDRYRPPEEEADPPDSPAVDEATDEKVDDPQLRRAIEHLEKKLLEKDAASQTA
ncbi:MAG: peptidase S41 [Planctomycetaceae bacterium]|nr:peptidase S41 [Planctomycetaceae bacterium]